jgi:hypothetical protein
MSQFPPSPNTIQNKSTTSGRSLQDTEDRERSLGAAGSTPLALQDWCLMTIGGGPRKEVQLLAEFRSSARWKVSKVPVVPVLGFVSRGTNEAASALYWVTA